MNWDKTKTILVAILVFTNLCLLGIFLNKNFRYQSNIDKEMEDFLKSRKITLKNEEYVFPKEIEKIMVEYDRYTKYNKKSLIKKFLGDNYLKKNETYLNSDYYLEITYNNLNYSKRGVTLGENKINKEEAKEIANKFVKKVGFLNNSVKLKTIDLKDNIYTITYKKYIDKKFVEESYIKVEILNDEVISFNREWLDHSKSGDELNKIISFKRALYKLENKMQNEEEVIIKDVELGYVLENKEINQKLQSGEAFPYYKFYLENGEVYYIEAIIS